MKRFNNEIIGYQNVNDGRILSVEKYHEMLEREILDFWNALDDYQKLEYDGFRHFREYHLNSPDPDFIPLFKDEI